MTYTERAGIGVTLCVIAIIICAGVIINHQAKPTQSPDTVWVFILEGELHAARNRPELNQGRVVNYRDAETGMERQLVLSADSLIMFREVPRGQWEGEDSAADGGGPDGRQPRQP